MINGRLSTLTRSDVYNSGTDYSSTSGRHRTTTVVRSYTNTLCSQLRCIRHHGFYQVVTERSNSEGMEDNQQLAKQRGSMVEGQRKYDV